MIRNAAFKADSGYGEEDMLLAVRALSRFLLRRRPRRPRVRLRHREKLELE